MIVQLALFAQLAASCAPHVAVETLAAVARTESGFDAFAIHDNSTGRSSKPGTREEAIALATELIVADRHSVDLGLMQINAANLPRLGLTIADAFDPCRSLAGADRVLVDGYAAPGPGGDEQAALRQALSRYNTGDPARGVANGYVGRVQAAAEVVVPAIRLQGEGAVGEGNPPPLGGGVPIQVQPLPPPPPSWDVYGQARVARGQGVVVFGTPRPDATPAPAMHPATPALAPTLAPGEPVQLRRLTNREAANDAR